MDTKETKDLVSFFASLANAVDLATADGLQAADFALFMGAIGKIPAAIDGISEVPKEVKDLDAAEKAEIIAQLKAELDLRDDVLEGILEEGLTIGVGLWGLVEKIRAARN
jgi:hypothetical protein